MEGCYIPRSPVGGHCPGVSGGGQHFPSVPSDREKTLTAPRGTVEVTGFPG